jgi:hypothetical protein
MTTASNTQTLFAFVKPNPTNVLNPPKAEELFCYRILLSAVGQNKIEGKKPWILNR